MNFTEAQEFLKTCTKIELRDHAFGDCEVNWFKDDMKIASGYFDGKIHEVFIHSGTTHHFSGIEAQELRKCFASEKVERNDETGPDEFEVGRVMPGLTLDGVYKELTGSALRPNHEQYESD